MSKRTRIHPVQFYLNDDEQYILEEKYRLSRMKQICLSTENDLIWICI